MRRRELLVGAVALGMTWPLAARMAGSNPVSDMTGNAPAEDIRLAGLLQRHAEALKAEEGGLDRLADYSLAARARRRQATLQRLAELRGIERAALSATATLDYDTARFVYEAMADQYGRYGFSDLNLRPSPYVVSQMNGAYFWLPDGIGGRSPMKDAADADRYLDKLGQFAVALDQETEQIRHDAGLGVIPPDFILAKTLRQIATLRDAAPTGNALTTSALARARDAGIADLDVNRVQLWLGDVWVAKDGGRNPSYQEADGKRVMQAAEIAVKIDLGRGAAEQTMWTCDLSHEYVSINADYRS